MAGTSLFKSNKVDKETDSGGDGIIKGGGGGGAWGRKGTRKRVSFRAIVCVHICETFIGWIPPGLNQNCYFGFRERRYL